MRPSIGDKSKYVGIEIECYGPLTREELIGVLANESSLEGKFQVGTDISIHPTNVTPTVTEVGPSEGAMNIEPREHATRSLDLAELIYRNGEWVDNRIITYRSSSRRQARLEDRRYWRNQDQESLATPSSNHAYEVRVLCKQSEVTKVVKKVYSILTNVGCETNDSCGLHVHLDMRYRNPMTAYHNLFKCQRMLLNLAPEEREDSRWCKTNTDDNLIDHLAAEYVDCDDEPFLDEVEKYYVINPLCYNKLKTIEIRVGEGTMESANVIAWVDLLTTIVDNQDELTTSYNDIDTFAENYDLTKGDSVETLQEMNRAA